MTGRHIICTQFPGTLQKSIELDFPVAKHIRIRCTAFFILVKHIIHHPLTILLAEVDKIERYTYFTGNKFSHETVLLPLAITMKSCRSIMPVLHEKGEHVVSLLLEQKSCNARINSTGKADTHLYFAVFHHILCILNKKALYLYGLQR